MKKILKDLFLFSLTGLISLNMYCQIIQDQEVLHLNGYTETVKGAGTLIPDRISTLYVEAYSGMDKIEWITGIVPESVGPKYIEFSWMAGIGASQGKELFEFFLNEEPILNFYSGKADWKSEKNNYRLTFNALESDYNGDCRGIMSLRIPAGNLISGKTQKLAIKGSQAFSHAWVMVTQKPVENIITLSQLPAVVNENGQNYQLVEARILNFEKEQQIFFRNAGKIIHETTAPFGFSKTILKLPQVSVKTNLEIEAKIEEQVFTIPLMLEPIRHWEVNLVQHTHTDIGFTRPQPEILADHLQFIDFALDMCDATDNYPEAAKFRWSCEVSWAVNEYLKSRPAGQTKRLVQRVREGRIEVTGMYLNYTDIPDEYIYAESMIPLRKFREYKIPVVSAMQSDVNGIGWCMNDYFNSAGVKYLTMATHGHRARILFDKPTFFHWVSPSGNKLLVFRSEHYHMANILGIHTNFEAFEKNLLEYLSDLEKKGYEYPVISLGYSGFYTDNSPPRILESEFIIKWNKKYEWPKLKNALNKDIFESIEKYTEVEIPTYSGAWPNWWNDGIAAGALELGIARRMHGDLVANQGLLSMTKIMRKEIPGYVLNNANEVIDQLLLYDEHTFSSSESISRPDSWNTMVQRGIKASYSWQAYLQSRMLREKTVGLMIPEFKNGEFPTITFFNTLNFERSGFQEVFVDFEIFPRDKPFSILDEKGMEIYSESVWRHNAGDVWRIWVEGIPPMGYKTYRVVKDDVIVPPVSEEKLTLSLENQYYRLVIDERTGAISSLLDKELNLELVDENAPWQLGQLISERLADRQQLQKIQIDRTTRIGPLDDYSRESVSLVKVGKVKNSILCQSIVIRADSRTTVNPGGVVLTLRLMNQSKLIQFDYSIVKNYWTDPEGIYIAFPFKLEDHTVRFETEGGSVVPGVSQLVSSGSDYYCIRSFAAARNGKAQIVLSSPDVPLMQFGDINTGKYQKISKVEHPYMYSWVMNNYWVTNWNADQRGEFKCSYYLTSTNNLSNTFATRFGWNFMVPIIPLIKPGGGEKGIKITGNKVLDFSAENIILLSSKISADNKGVILQIRETEGKKTRVRVSSPLMSLKNIPLVEVSVIGEVKGKRDTYVDIEPWETKFIYVVL
jgi:alpha-mannosidase